MARQIKGINNEALRRYDDIEREIGSPPEFPNARWDHRYDEMVEKAGIHRLDDKSYDLGVRMTSVIAKALEAGADPTEMGLSQRTAMRFTQAHKQGKKVRDQVLNKVVKAVAGKSMYR